MAHLKWTTRAMLWTVFTAFGASIMPMCFYHSVVRDTTDVAYPLLVALAVWFIWMNQELRPWRIKPWKEEDK